MTQSDISTMAQTTAQLTLTRWLRAADRRDRYPERPGTSLPVPRYVQAGIRYGLVLGLDDTQILTTVRRSVTPPPSTDQIRSSLSIAHRRPIDDTPISLSPGAPRVVTDRHLRLARTLVVRVLVPQDANFTPAALATARRALMVIGSKAMSDIDAGGFADPIVTAGWLAKSTGLTTRRARDVIGRLEALGWLELHKVLAGKSWPVFRIVEPAAEVAAALPARFEQTVYALAAARPAENDAAAALMLAGHIAISFAFGRPDHASQLWLAAVTRAGRLTNQAGRPLGLSARPAADRRLLDQLAAGHPTLEDGLTALAETPAVWRQYLAAQHGHQDAAAEHAAGRAPFVELAARNAELAAERSTARRWLLSRTEAGWLDSAASPEDAYHWLVRLTAGIVAHDKATTRDPRTGRPPRSRKRPLSRARRQLLAEMVASDLRRVGVDGAVADEQAALALNLPTTEVAAA